MGVEPFLVAYSVNLVVAQRLARQVCPACKEKVDVSPKTLAHLGFDREDAMSVVCYRGVGCNNCRGTGYAGRVALYEVMPITDEIRDAILAGDTGQEIKRSAIRNGMKTLRMSGLTKLAEGKTSVEEVMRITF
jgi:type IV pilus assembly protein PilB